MKVFTLALFLTITSLQAEIIHGKKYPNQKGFLDFPFTVPAIKYAPRFDYILPTESKLDLSHNMLAAPYQGDTGSCMFMSLTGTVEWWLNKLSKVNPTYDGDTDLSERVLMNLSKMDVGRTEDFNWRTDSIYRMNYLKKSIRNRDFRFTKGWHKKDPETGKRKKVSSTTKGAIYSTAYNWIIDLPDYQGDFVSLPEFKREVIFKEPNNNQWGVGVTPKDIVKKIKMAMSKNKAPVNVIYNSHGFWHAVVIVGYDDYRETEGCPLVSGYENRMNKRAIKILDMIKNKEITGEKQIAKAKRKARSLVKKGKHVKKLLDERGGCNKEGVFYVRDSGFPNENAPLYDYDLNHLGEEEKYSHQVILRSYKWFEVLGNHAFQILAK